MMTLPLAFWTFVIIFAVIGAMRGWAKELLVSFSVILCLFIFSVLQRYVPPIGEFISRPTSTGFWIRTFILLMLVFFGYQTPNLPKLQNARFLRDKFSDSFLGFFIGIINGILIVGSIWYFMDQSNYPFKPYITKPPEPIALLNYLPTRLFLTAGTSYIYFAIAIAFIFVLVVFI
jgi:uncharacterized membrane protein required for colicin V production